MTQNQRHQNKTGQKIKDSRILQDTTLRQQNKTGHNSENRLYLFNDLRHSFVNSNFLIINETFSHCVVGFLSLQEDRRYEYFVQNQRIKVNYLINRFINDFLLFSCNLESTNKPDHILEVKELVLCEIWWTIKKKNKDDFKVAWQEIPLLLEYH